MRLSLLCWLAAAASAASPLDDILAGAGVEEAGLVAAVKAGAGGEGGARALGFKKKHLGLAMERGMWDLATALVDVAAALKINVESDLQMETSRVQRRLGALKAHLKKGQGRSQTAIVPTTKWTQSAEDVHIWVKFAHKLDTPAQVNSKAHPAAFTNGSLSFNASNPNKLFRLDLSLFAAIDPGASAGCTMGSAGTCTFVLRKAKVNATWPRLLKGRKKPRNQHHWHERQEQLRQSVDEGEAWVRDAPNRERREREEKERVEREQKEAIERHEKGQADDAAAAATGGGEGSGEGPDGGAAGQPPLTEKEKEEL
jgi:hypothetical protein